VRKKSDLDQYDESLPKKYSWWGRRLTFEYEKRNKMPNPATRGDAQWYLAFGAVYRKDPPLTRLRKKDHEDFRKVGRKCSS